MKKIVTLFTIILLSSAIVYASKPTIHLMGDSLMSKKDTALSNHERGWGMFFPEFVDSGVNVVNYAVGGRSTKSFIGTGKWEIIARNLREGDWLLIQLGHNDHGKKKGPERFTEPFGEYQENLRLFCRTAIEKGAKPILLTPVTRRYFDEDGHMMEKTIGDHPEAMRQVAAELGVPLLDIYALTHEWVEGLGDEASKNYYMWLTPEDEPLRHPDGRKDNTHLNIQGAYVVNTFVCKEIRAKVPELAKHLNGFDLAGGSIQKKAAKADCGYSAKSAPVIPTFGRKDFSFKKNPPFSFKYGGVPSARLLPQWKYSTMELTPERKGESLCAHIWRDPETGLEVECRVKTFSDFNAMEWVLYFRNTFTEDTPILSEIKTVDMYQEARTEGEWTLFHSRGAIAGGEDFRPEATSYKVGQLETLCPDKGRSSSGTMPYFNVKTPDGGLVYAIGWTGQWKANISRPAAQRMRVEAGMYKFEAYLTPGEQVRQPSVVVVPWQGSDRMDGQNILRRLIMAHYHPLDVAGEPMKVPIFSNVGINDGWPCDEFTCLTDYSAIMMVKNCRMFGLLTDGFWIDAGWYSRARGWDKGYWWHNAVGNWTPDPERFPDGIAPIADEVHKDGGKLMVWYEPERANVDSDWAHEHPEFMIAQDGKKAVPIEAAIDSAFLVNLGNPAALKWVGEQIVQSLTEGKIDCYRQDFNIDPLDFWVNNDGPARAGTTEAHYIEGLYKYLDYLREQLPFLMIDNCAGGGRRLDIEMTRRSMPMWRDDFPSTASYNQNYTYGLSQWLPVHCTGVRCRDQYRVLSALTAGGVLNWDGMCIPDHKRLIELQKEAAPYFLEEFYPLTGYDYDPLAEDFYMSYQLDRRSDDTGLVFAFRREKCDQDSCIVKLRGLNPRQMYHLESIFNFSGAKRGIDYAEYGIMPFTKMQYPDCPFQTVEMTGEEIMSGLTIPLTKKFSSVLIKYTPVEGK